MLIEQMCCASRACQGIGWGRLWHSEAIPVGPGRWKLKLGDVCACDRRAAEKFLDCVRKDSEVIFRQAARTRRRMEDERWSARDRSDRSESASLNLCHLGTNYKQPVHPRPLRMLEHTCEISSWMSPALREDRVRRVIGKVSDIEHIRSSPRNRKSKISPRPLYKTLG